MTSRPQRLAIVLSGGGARGAYEVGVLSYVFDELSRVRGRDIVVDILCGTSVGAINSAFLAATLAEPRLGVHRLMQIWQEVRLDNVMGFGWRQAGSLAGFFQRGAVKGLVDVAPMARFLRREVPWSQIGRTMRSGRLRALSITATEVHTGRTVLFMQTGPGTSMPTHAPPRTLMRAERIGPPHVLASASIPLIFPPVPVGNQLYTDGGLRHNTPMAPAIRLGATHVLVVGTSRLVRGVDHQQKEREPTTAFVLGKVMNAMLLDHLDNDLAQLALVNDLQETGVTAFGDAFTEQMNRAAGGRGGHRIQPVETLIIRPSIALGAICADYLKKHTVATNSQLTRRLLHWLDSGSEADLASYLLFDGGYASQLMELGRSDARAQRDRILDFFAQLEETAPSAPGTEGGMSFPPPAVG